MVRGDMRCVGAWTPVLQALAMEQHTSPSVMGQKIELRENLGGRQT